MSQSSGSMWVYQLGIQALKLGMRIGGRWNAKMRKGLEGRKNWREKLQAVRKADENWVWVHCASLGEFEQGRNLIDEISQHHPNWKVMLTFFSPSGYEIRKSYRHADAVMYLPLDTPAAARDFVRMLAPKLVLFVKYELWLNLISEVHKAGIPLLLVAARLTPESSFLNGPLKKLYTAAFQRFTHIFTQDQRTLDLLEPIVGKEALTVSSDTRYDRVMANREAFIPIPEVEKFVGERMCLVVGSSWPVEEKMLLPVCQRLFEDHDLCLIIAPHEIHTAAIDHWVKAYAPISLKFSQIETLQPQHRILWIDNIGMLSRLYAYANIAYVGGGWKTGLHNILEPTIFGCPVVFGPKHHRFPEAAELIEIGGGFSIASEQQMEETFRELLGDDARRERIKADNQQFIQERAGATRLILDWCYAKKLLPSPPTSEV